VGKVGKIISLFLSTFIWFPVRFNIINMFGIKQWLESWFVFQTLKYIKPMKTRKNEEGVLISSFTLLLLAY
jgi:hypothetical protein